jgi:D-alanyl-D-alanine carboxypeptidase (penicillin-binding protein 5/6)
VRFPVLPLFLLLAALTARADMTRPPEVRGTAWLLADLTSGQVLAAEKADERVEPASLAKLMTAYVVFAALRDGALSLERPAAVSQRAWKMPGSRMFVQPGRPVTVDELIHGVVVHSGNDACIVLAETLAGSETAFVALMNREAERLGMANTHFVNATGLPEAQQYSTARDLHLLAAALIRDFPVQYARYFAQREYRYNGITQANRNGLLWLDPSVDGVKTGRTETAGFCLIASSKRGARRLLSVLLGANSETDRAHDSQKLLNWGFQAFDSVRLFDEGVAAKSLEVWKGSSARVRAGFGSSVIVTVPKGEAERLRAELLAQAPLEAPIAAGQRIGVLRLSFDNRLLREYPLVALEPVALAGFFGRAWDTLRLWMR